ncbi:MAG: Sister chromatid cohesion protein 2 [Cirrosporium novae-zelandiae]|nr:MAG: Sister chromatid cohesion protein 2 [Cirrosporium novae-zelandiae]
MDGRYNVMGVSSLPPPHPLPHPHAAVRPQPYTANATNGSYGTVEKKILRKPLDVNQALQYSPFSSVVPFNSDVIALPSIRQSSSHVSLLTPQERSTTDQILKYLDSEASYNPSSNLGRQVIQSLQQLLDPDEISEFKFKVPSAHGSTNPTAPNHTNGISLSSTQLGAFENMVLEFTAVEYRYPTPSSLSPPSERAQSPPKTVASRKPIPEQPTPTTLQAQYVLVNQKAYQQNEAPSASESSHTPPQSNIPFKVAVPLIVDTQRQVYATLPNDDARILAQTSKIIPSKKRKRDEADGDNQARTQLMLDQKEKANAASAALQDYLQDVFEAEDQIQSDFGSASAEVASFFLPMALGEQGSATLSPKVHTKLENLISRVVSFKRFGEVPVENLSRIQKLCEASISSTQATDFRVDDDWNDGNLEHWRQQVVAIETGLLSARTVLKIMIGGREETQLYPEELLQSILDMLSHVLDHCLLPIVELRNGSTVFKFASSQKRSLSMLFHHTGNVMRYLADLFSSVEVAETAITTTEFLCCKAIFAENAHSEKDSALGIQRYEILRRTTMDLLSRIFARYASQRTFILDEILASLEKLPSTKQSARQFKLGDGTNIQLITALIMQLVQTSSAPVHETTKKSKGYLGIPSQDVDSSDEGNSPDHSSDDEPLMDGHRSGNSRLKSNGSALQNLQREIESLHRNTTSSANYIASFFVQRALTSTKSGDQPYRQLLDLFTQDLLQVLGSTDWPSAEILLRVLMVQFLRLADSDKSAAPAKNMALELLGWMASAISDKAAAVRQLSKGLNVNESRLNASLVQLADKHLHGRLSGEDLLDEDGPYGVVLEYMTSRKESDLHLESACSYLLVVWARALCMANFENQDKAEELALRLDQSLADPRLFATEQVWGSITPLEARLAFGIVTLNQDFCKTFERILSVLLGLITSDQATVRSRSMKSVTQMLEKDPSLLDRGPSVMRLILKSATDQSSMVRDSALSLIGKCITLKPNLEEASLGSILTCAADSAVGVRKRAMKLLREIYLRSSRMDIKAVIADSLIQRVMDHDEGVAELARQMFEEIWMSPFYASVSASNQTPQTQITLKDQCRLIIKTVQRGEKVIAVLELVLKNILSNNAKFAKANYQVCQALVAKMFDEMLDDTDTTNHLEPRYTLQALAVFAHANAKLFSPEQIKLLLPYLGNLSTQDDLFLFRSAVTILRCVLPRMSKVQEGLLRDVQGSLFKLIQRLARAELHEAISCLWTINGVLGNIERLANLTISVLQKIYESRGKNLSDSTQQRTLTQVKILVRLAGVLGKFCKFEKTINLFKQRFPWWKGNSVPQLMIDLIHPFAGSKQPLELRAWSLDALGSICQSWPRLFEREQVKRAFTTVFEEGNLELQDIVTKAFRDFSVGREKSAAASTDAAPQSSQENSMGKLGASMVANDTDGASAFIVQLYLEPILRIALASQDSHATPAVEFIASINKQGLLHPKECLPGLVAMETSTNSHIVNLAIEQHRHLHQNHESILEKEYMRAVHEAFEYQRRVVKDISGISGRSTAKLHNLFDIIKISSAKYQRKFLNNLCARVNFEPEKLDGAGKACQEHLEFARFVLENIALFEYARMDDIFHVVSGIERIVSSTGTVIAQSIESDVFKNTLGPPLVEEAQVGPALQTVEGYQNPQVLQAAQIGPVDPVQPERQIPDIEQHKLERLTIFAIILSIAWEVRTFLRRLYGLSGLQQRREGKAKQSAKEINKAPTKAHGVTAEKFSEVISRISRSLDTRETMLERCKEFAELLAVDSELKVGAESDDDRASLDGASLDDEEDTAVSPEGRGKRKGSGPIGGIPKRQRGKANTGRKSSSSKPNGSALGGW